MSKLVEQFTGVELLHYAHIAKLQGLLDPFSRKFLGQTGKRLQYYSNDFRFSEKQDALLAKICLGFWENLDDEWQCDESSCCPICVRLRKLRNSYINKEYDLEPAVQIAYNKGARQKSKKPLNDSSNSRGNQTSSQSHRLSDLRAKVVCSQESFKIQEQELETTAFYQVLPNASQIIITLNTAHPVYALLRPHVDSSNPLILLFLMSLAKYEIDSPATNRRNQFAEFRADWGLVLRKLVKNYDVENMHAE